MAKWKDDTMAELLADVQQQPVHENEPNMLPVDCLVAFTEHPFRPYAEDKMREMESSIRVNGILTPLLVRPTDEPGRYEIISGHNRWEAARRVGLSHVPVVIKNVDDDSAVLMMVDSNFQQRDEILPSEKAFAYKMKLASLKRQGKRHDLTSAHSGQKWTARDAIAQGSGESAQNIRRYIRLTHLIPTLRQKVDEKKLGFIPAVDLSYLSPEEQTIMNRIMEARSIKPSKEQAEKLKHVSQKKGLRESDILAILTRPKLVEFSAWKPAKQFQSYLPVKMRNDMTIEQADRILAEAMQLWLERHQNEL